MSDPVWLQQARAEGRVLGEKWANPPAVAPASTPTPTRQEGATSAAGKPARAQKGTSTRTATSTTPGPTRLVIEVDVPIRLVSEANAGGRLGAKIGRKGKVKAAVRAALPKLVDPFPLPVVVTLTRLGGRQLDADDNLPISLKAPKDVVAEWLGVSDTGRDVRVRWKFKQLAAYTAGCRIRIESQRLNLTQWPALTRSPPRTSPVRTEGRSGRRRDRWRLSAQERQ